MKRLALLTVLLLVVGLAMGFSLDFKPSLTLTGNVTAGWGINLDSPNGTGFSNGGDANLTVSLVADGSSDSKTGKGDIYGYIKITDIELYFVDGVEFFGGDKETDTKGAWKNETTGDNAGYQVMVADLPSWSGSIYFAGGLIELGLGANDSADVVSDIEAGTLSTGNAAMDNIVDDESSVAPAIPGPGIAVRYHDPSGLVVGLDVDSEKKFSDNATGGYAIGPEVAMTFAPVTAKAAVWYAAGYAAPTMLAGYVNLALDLTGIGTASVGADWEYSQSGTFGAQIGANAQMNFNKDATAYLQAKAVYVLKSPSLDAEVIFMIPSATVLGPIYVDTTIYALDIGNSGSPEFASLSHLGYGIPISDTITVTPNIAVGYGFAANVSSAQASDIGINELNAQPAIFNVYPNVKVSLASGPTTFVTVGWKSGNLLATTPGLGSISATFEVDY